MSLPEKRETVIVSVRYLKGLTIVAPRRISIVGISVGSSLAFVYLRIVGKTSLFPVRDPRLVQSLKLVN